MSEVMFYISLIRLNRTFVLYGMVLYNRDSKKMVSIVSKVISE